MLDKIPINWNLISNPVNWVIVILMISIAGLGIAAVFPDLYNNEDN